MRFAARFHDLALRVLFGGALLALFLPRLVVAGRSYGLDDVVGLAFLVLVGAWIVVDRRTVHARAFWLVVAPLAGVVAYIVGTGIVNGLVHVGSITIPTEAWQHAKRLGYVLGGYALIRVVGLTLRTVLTTWFLALIAAGVIGVIQFAGGTIGDALARVYARSEGQFEGLARRGASVRRVFGVAGHSTSWGGFAAFGAALAAPAAWIARGEPLRFVRATALTLFLLMTANLVLSGARAPLVGLAVAMTLIVIAVLFDRRVPRTTRATGLMAIVLGLVAVASVFADRVAFLLFRFEALLIQVGGGRIDQVRRGLDLLDGPTAWLVGVGNAAQRSFAVGHGIEVEPIYLLVNYGLLGLVLFALVIGTVLVACLARFRHPSRLTRALAIGLAAGFVHYLVFSSGYFFLQEIVVGAPPWFFVGVLLATDPVHPRAPGRPA